MAATSQHEASVHETPVLKVLPRGRVIIDARNLRRVMDRVTGEVHMELLEQSCAEIAAQTMNDIANNNHVIVVPYKAAKPRKRVPKR